jgi:hypothetical protein
VYIFFKGWWVRPRNTRERDPFGRRKREGHGKVPKNPNKNPRYFFFSFFFIPLVKPVFSFCSLFLLQFSFETHAAPSPLYYRFKLPSLSKERKKQRNKEKKKIRFFYFLIRSTLTFLKRERLTIIRLSPTPRSCHINYSF